MSATRQVAATEHAGIVVRWFRVDMAPYYGAGLVDHDYMRWISVGILEVAGGRLIVDDRWEPLHLHDRALAYISEQCASREDPEITADAMMRHPLWLASSGHRASKITEAMDLDHARDMGARRYGYQDYEDYLCNESIPLIIKQIDLVSATLTGV